MKFDYMFQSIKDKCLVLDIETSAIDPAGREISIHAQFDAYVEFADVKWFGAYSFKNDELYLLNTITERDKIIELLSEYEILIGFNLEEFDIPILKNRDFIDKEKKYTYIDCMQILGKSNFKNKSGYAYKNRGGLMNYSFKNNSLISFSGSNFSSSKSLGSNLISIFSSILKSLHNDIWAYESETAPLE